MYILYTYINHSSYIYIKEYFLLPRLSEFRAAKRDEVNGKTFITRHIFH